MDVDSFIRDGFVAIRQAVDASTAAACRELIWQSMAERGLQRSDPASWPPLVRIDDLDAGPFTAAGLSPTLVAAYDELIGPGRWKSPVDVGRAVMVRFPSQDRAGAGYHIEASYPGPAGRGWRANVRSRSLGLCRPISHATGKAGDVFLCHPFIVHTAIWPHRGTGPRMIAQPAVIATAGFTLDGTDPSPIAQAIVSALAMTE